MRIALISDIHSNHLALKAVLGDIPPEVDETVFLGDSVGYGPEPDRVFPLLRDPQFGIKGVMGNYEESIILGKKDCGCEYIADANIRMAMISFQWTLDHLSPDNVEYMKSLPREIRKNIGGKRVLMVHGTPDKINGKIEFHDPEDGLIALMERAEADILFCAHTHLPFHRIIGDYHIINPGSVGRARWGSPQASYAVVDIGKTVGVRFRFVDYDHESFAREIETSAMPKNNFAEVIRTGYWKF